MQEIIYSFTKLMSKVNVRTEDSICTEWLKSQLQLLTVISADSWHISDKKLRIYSRYNNLIIGPTMNTEIKSFNVKPKRAISYFEQWLFFPYMVFKFIQSKGRQYDTGFYPIRSSTGILPNRLDCKSARGGWPADQLTIKQYCWTAELMIL